MKIPSLKGLVDRAQAKLNINQDPFLKEVSGVVHVGANLGQERGTYNHFNLNVVWLEPIPEIFRLLQQNISKYPKQRAIECLVTDRDGAEYQFHVANNNGASSSILDFKDHADIWPDVNFEQTITLRSSTLASVFNGEKLDNALYQALVMDTQGSELLVLQGAVPILGHFNYVKTEVPDFEAYAGCCQLDDIQKFMNEHGFAELSRKKFAERPQGGCYYDVIYRRN